MPEQLYHKLTEQTIYRPVRNTDYEHFMRRLYSLYAREPYRPPRTTDVAFWRRNTSDQESALGQAKYPNAGKKPPEDG